MIRFVLNGEEHTVDASVVPSTTMLDYLRDRLRMTGTKEGCAEGDCGACTVVRVAADGKMEAVNSCLMQLGQADGQEILTVEGLQAANGGEMMPVQDAMANGDGTQCGFCTPGFIGALYALQQSGEKIDDETIHDALAGNLCRCTGYRPIIEAARAACGKAVPYKPAEDRPDAEDLHEAPGQTFHAPTDLAELTALRAANPRAMLLAGGTDLGLLASKQRIRPPVVIHTSRVTELQELTETEEALTIGAAVTYTNALPYIERLYPSLATLVHRIGSRQIRNLGTIGGNIGNASPIGDTPPSLIALGATVALVSPNASRGIPLEEFFIDYRRTDLAPNEIIRSVTVPKLGEGESFRVYKISKRYDQDISSVVGAFKLKIDGGKVTEARIAFGGMAATPKRAAAAEGALVGADMSENAFRAAGEAVLKDFAPISDHRASAEYRTRVAANLFVRLYRDLAGTERELEVVGL